VLLIPAGERFRVAGAEEEAADAGDLFHFGLSRHGPALREKSGAGRRDANARVAVAVLGCEEPAIVGLFPDGQARAGGAPGFDDFLVGALAQGDPFKEVEDEGFDGVDHMC